MPLHKRPLDWTGPTLTPFASHAVPLPLTERLHVLLFLFTRNSFMHCAARHGPCVKQRPQHTTRTTDCILRAGSGIFPLLLDLDQKAFGVVVFPVPGFFFLLSFGLSLYSSLERLGVFFFFFYREKRMGWTPSGLWGFCFFCCCFAFSCPHTGGLSPSRRKSQKGHDLVVPLGSYQPSGPSFRFC